MWPVHLDGLLYLVAIYCTYNWCLAPSDDLFHLVASSIWSSASFGGKL